MFPIVVIFVSLFNLVFYFINLGGCFCLKYIIVLLPCNDRFKSLGYTGIKKIKSLYYVVKKAVNFCSLLKYPFLIFNTFLETVVKHVLKLSE